MIGRRILFLLVAVSAVATATVVAVSVWGIVGRDSDVKVPIMAEETAVQTVGRYADQVAQVIGLNKSVIGPYPSVAPCGPDEKVENLPNGDFNPYNVLGGGRIDGVPADQLEPTIYRVRDHYQNAGWTIVRFKPTGLDGKPILEVSAANTNDGYEITVEAMVDQNALGVDVLSPCYKHPPSESATQ